MDANGASDEGTGCGRKRRVVLAPRRWCQVRGRKLSRVTVAKEPEHRGEHAIIRKTIAWGMPGESGVTCMLVCAFYSILHTRPWGASSARHSLRPFRGRGDRNQANLAQQPAARSRRRGCMNSWIAGHASSTLVMPGLPPSPRLRRTSTEDPAKPWRRRVTRASINLRENLTKRMNCRVKPDQARQ